MLQIYFLADAATLLISQNSVGLRNVFQYVVDQCNQISCIACRYQHTLLHRQTKPQWARDDPAFVVVCGALVVLAGLAYFFVQAKRHSTFVLSVLVICSRALKIIALLQVQ